MNNNLTNVIRLIPAVNIWDTLLQSDFKKKKILNDQCDQTHVEHLFGAKIKTIIRDKLDIEHPFEVNMPIVNHFCNIFFSVFNVFLWSEYACYFTYYILFVSHIRISQSIFFRAHIIHTLCIAYTKKIMWTKKSSNTVVHILLIRHFMHVYVCCSRLFLI